MAQTLAAFLIFLTGALGHAFAVTSKDLGLRRDRPCPQLLKIFKNLNGQTKSVFPESIVSTYHSRVGDRFFLSPGAFQIHPSIQKRLKAPIEVQVIREPYSAKPQNGNGRLWKLKGLFLEVRSTELGDLRLPVTDTIFEAFSNSQFQGEFNYAPGDFVQIGKGFEREPLVLKRFNNRAVVRIFPTALPYPGRFLKTDSDGTMRLLLMR
jgi:hypothetical protein